MVRDQWLQLKTKSLLSHNMKLLFGGGITAFGGDG